MIATAHLIEHFGRWWVDSINEAAIEDLQDGVKAAPATVNGWHRVLRLILDRAVREGLYSSNAARKVRTLSEPRMSGRRANSLDLHQFRKMVSVVENLEGTAIAPDVARMIFVLAWTGMRMGELTALKSSDVVDGEIRVERSVWRRCEKPTKMEDPRRVPVTEPLQKVLEAQRHWLLTTKHPGLGSGLVFPARANNVKAGAKRRKTNEPSWYRSHSVLSKPLVTVAQAVGVPPFSPHALRRTFEDLLRRAGVDELVRRSMAGWRSDKVQRIYARQRLRAGRPRGG